MCAAQRRLSDARSVNRRELIRKKIATTPLGHELEQ